MSISQLPRIVIVDDEVAQMRALTDTLNANGYEATGFSSAGAALDALRSSRVELLLTDLSMPEMNGITLLKMAQQIDSDLIGIIMTGEGTIGSAVEAMKSGALDYILKPFKLSAILPVLNRACAVRELRVVNAVLEQKVEQKTLELERAHEALEISSQRIERQSQRIFETSQDVIAVTDSYGKFVQLSPSCEKVLGYRPDEMVGRLGQDFILPDDRELTRDAMKAARGGFATRNFRSRYVHKDGHVVPISWMAIWSEPDRRHFFIGRDLTETEQTEEQLRQAQKMEAVGQLTGGIAHDFNNILMVVMANVESLEDEHELAPEILERVKGIAKAADRASDLTRQLLTFSRKQALRPQRTNINDLVANIGALLRRTLGAQIEIEALLSEDLWDAEIDRAQLDSALVNLCINARDAMPDGGRLLIETQNVTLDEDYVSDHREVDAGDYARLSVTDTGAGMPPEVLNKVFEPFFTTKGMGKGTGLGLSMVYGFIKQSKGHISIYSEVGAGTSIKLYLPRSTSAKSDLAPRQTPDLPKGTESILVVDDDELVRAIVVKQLKSLGYDATEAPDGQQGLAAVEALSKPFDLLLTDVIMPGPINGKTLAEKVQKNWPGTKVVFMSGYTENAIVHHGQLDAGVLLLSKPFRKSDLAQMVRQALDQRSAQ